MGRHMLRRTDVDTERREDRRFEGGMVLVAALMVVVAVLFVHSGTQCHPRTCYAATTQHSGS